MRSALVVVFAVFAAATLPSFALSQGMEGMNHGGESSPNPLEKTVILYPDATGSLTTVLPSSAALVTAGPSNVDGTSTPIAWTTSATKNSTIASAPYVVLTLVAVQPTVAAGGPDGNALKFEFLHNGKPVEGSAGYAKLQSSTLTQGQEEKVTLFLPQVTVALAPGDALGLQVSFYGLNPEQAPAVKYKVGGESNSRIVFKAKLASVAELDLPAGVGPWPVAPLEGFDFKQASKKDPSVKEFTLKAFQFGFQDAPVVVPNGSKVVVHLYVDESLSPSQEGHAGHGGMEGMEGMAMDHAMPWDQSMLSPLHGFSLAALDPKLQTVLFDNLVVTVTFNADKPGNYTFMCIVFCGSGHGGMMDRLTIEGPPAPLNLEKAPESPSGNKTPGLPTGAAVLALAALAIAIRKRTR